MSQIFDEKGIVIPITLVEAGPCHITQTKSEEKDKYKALQIGFVKKTKKIKKTEKGKEFKYLREFRIVKDRASEGSEGKEEDKVLFALGDMVDVSVFQEGDKVKVSGVSKGKGFQGVVKRWGFKGRLSSTHGTKHELRTGGSTGSSMPERVIKGKKMAGRMGTERVTVSNMRIVKVDKENNLLALKGAVPGRRGTLLEIKG